MSPSSVRHVTGQTSTRKSLESVQRMTLLQCFAIQTDIAGDQRTLVPVVTYRGRIPLKLVSAMIRRFGASWWSPFVKPNWAFLVVGKAVNREQWGSMGINSGQ